MARDHFLCKKMHNIILMLLLPSYHIDTSTRSKDLKQTLLQEIDMAMMDNSSQNHFIRIALYRTFKSAIFPS